MDDKIIFLHLYKTGGQTLRNLFTHQTPPSQYFDIGKHGFDDFLALPAAERERIRLVFGHVKYGMHCCFEEPEKVHYLTMLRDPVERIRSLHRYVNQNARLDLHRLMPERERRELPDFLHHIDRYSPYHGNNGMCKSIAGTDRAFPAGNLWDRRIRNKVDEGALLDAALANLESRFLEVGLLEWFDESIIFYKWALGWQKPLFYLQRNHSQRDRSAQLEPGLLELIKEKNQYDCQLYERVRTQFLERLSTYREELDAEIRRTKFNNRMYTYYRRFYRDPLKKVLSGKAN